jgi:hypothetical protein
MSDREYIRELAKETGWTWTAWEGGVATVVRGSVLIRFWFKADDLGTLHCAEGYHWKRESYGPAALRRTVREMRKMP